MPAFGIREWEKRKLEIHVDKWMLRWRRCRRSVREENFNFQISRHPLGT